MVSTTTVAQSALEQPLDFASGSAGSSSSASPPDSGDFRPHKRPDDDAYDYEEPPAHKARTSDSHKASSHAHSHMNGKGKKPITEKRRDQNRRAQQAFRDRKEARVHDLEARIDELADLNAQKDRENASLRQLIEQMRSEKYQEARTDSSAEPEPIAEPAFTFQLPATLGEKEPTTPSEAGLQTGFLSGMSGYAFSPQSLTSTLGSATEALYAPADMGSPTNVLSPGNDFGDIEDFLALDDGTTVDKNVFDSASSSTTSEVKTPGQRAESIDIDSLCTKFKENAQCSERAKKLVDDAAALDEAHMTKLQHSSNQPLPI